MGRRVLVIDNYDSFVYNLVQYLGELGAEPLVYRHDALTLDQEIPPVEDFAKQETKYVKHLRIRSERLSRFWGRDMYLGAWVLLPWGFDEHPGARYPLVIDHGHFPAIATHDVDMIAATKRYAAERGYGKDRFEFQMLYGIRRDLQTALVREGYGVRIYVPFGREWFPYFMRRLGERPANVGFVLRGLLRER